MAMNIKPGQAVVAALIFAAVLLVAGGGQIKAAAGAMGDADGGALDGTLTDADCAPESFTAWYHPGREGSGHFTRKYNSTMPSYGRGGDMQCPL